MSDAAAPRPSRLAVLMFTDIVDSTHIKSRLGTTTYVRLLGLHDQLFRKLIAAIPGAQVLQDVGDGYFAAFETVSDAVTFALRFQHEMSVQPWEPEPLRSRVGIHVGEVAQMRPPEEAGGGGGGGGGAKLIGMAADVAARVMSLAMGGQILLTRTAFDDARQFVSEFRFDGEAPVPLRWMAHGDYLLKGNPDPLEVFEVGMERISPLTAPADTEKARRSVSAEQEETLGWRPAVGLIVPERPGWVLEKKLGEGTFGEVWLARHQKLKQHRVFKFCFDVERLRSFKRELTLFRLLQDALGDRRDIARLYDVRLDRPPFFLESEYAEAGNLLEWAARQESLRAVALAARLEIVAKVADAVAAAHSVGVLHKDLKPSNILVHVEPDGTVLPRLSDFGIGTVVDRGRLAGRNITEAGFTGITVGDSSRTGTRLYMPPESLSGRPFTIQGDIYALGVFLYQMVVGELNRPLAVGWERDVPDELLREDIARCVEGDSQQRLSSATELAQRIRALPQRRSRRQFERRRRNAARFAAAALGVLVLLTVAGAVGYVRERSLRQRAVDAERTANEQRGAADRERRRAETLLADSYVDHGRQLAAAASFNAGWESFERARAQYESLGLSPLPADLALLELNDRIPSPLLTLSGHSDTIFAAVGTRDGRRIVTGGQDGTLRIWDTRTGRELQQVDAGGVVMTLDVSPDGKTALSAGTAVKLWDLSDFRQIRTLPPTGLRAACFLPDGRRIVTARDVGRVVQVWDSETREMRLELPPQKGNIRALQVVPGGRLLVGLDVRMPGVVAYDLETGKELWTAETVSGVRAIGLHPDGKRAVVGGYLGQLEILDLATGQCHPLGPGGAGIIALAIAPDGEAILVGRDDGSVRSIDLDSGEQIQSLSGSSQGIRTMHLLEGGRILIAGGLDRKLRLWDLAPTSRRVATRSSYQHPGTVFALDTRVTIALAHYDPQSVVFDTATAQPLAIVGHDDPLFARLYPDASRDDLQWTDDGLEALRSGRSIWRIKLDMNDIEELLDFNAQHRLLVFQHKDFSLSVWRTDGRRIATLPGHNAQINAIIEDSSTLTTIGADRTMREWDLSSSAQRRRIELPIFPEHWTIWRPLCITSDIAGKISVFDMETGRLRTSLVGHVGLVRTIKADPERQLLVSFGEDNTVRLWDLSSGRQLFRFGGSTPLIDHEPGFAPNSRQLLIVAQPRPGVQELKWWDLDRTAAEGVHQSRLAEAAQVLAGNQKDPPAAALGVFGNWYAFRGMDPWAVELLEESRKGGGDVSSLTLARCYWKLGRRAEAEREFRAAIERKEAPDEYLRLCLQAVQTPPAFPAVTSSAPTTRPRRRFERRPPQWTPGAATTRATTAAATPADSLDAQNIQAWRLRRDGKLDEAARLRAAVVEEASQLLAADDPRLLKYRTGYGELLAQMKRLDEAEAQYLAIERAISALPDTAPAKVDVNLHLARLYVEWQKPEEAKKYELKLAATRPSTGPSRSDPR